MTQIGRRTVIDNDAWENKRVPINEVIRQLREAKRQGYTVVTVGGSGDGLSSWLDVEKPASPTEGARPDPPK